MPGGITSRSDRSIAHGLTGLSSLSMSDVRDRPGCFFALEHPFVSEKSKQTNHYWIQGNHRECIPPVSFHKIPQVSRLSFVPGKIRTLTCKTKALAPPGIGKRPR
jgi:hypothetical protein